MIQYSKYKNFLNKIKYAIGSNLISLLVSVLTTLLIPKYLGNIEQYGYYRMYLFYASYVGLFHLGWCDGILLKDGGKKYEDLDKAKYSSQFWLLCLTETIIFFSIIIGTLLYSDNSNTKFISCLVASNLIVYIPTLMLSYFLQMTNRIREYALIISFNKFAHILIIIINFIIGTQKYELFVLGEITSQLFGLGYACYICKDIISVKPIKLIEAVKHASKYIYIGSKLLFSNLASMLITGIVQWGVQLKWDVTTYGKISFTLSISNLVLTFINAIAIVLFPTLRRIERERLSYIYCKARNMLTIILFGCLVFYCPIRVVLSAWLPQYSESLKYMAFLFPVCVYAAKMTMLIQTYMNVLRLEKIIMKINILGMVIAVVTTVITVFLFENVTLAMVSIVINQMFRCIYAEHELSKHIQITVSKDILIEILLTVVFVLSNGFVGEWYGAIIYLIFYLIFLFSKKRDVIEKNSCW